jgi:hypothetical protein
MLHLIPWRVSWYWNNTWSHRVQTVTLPLFPYKISTNFLEAKFDNKKIRHCACPWAILTNCFLKKFSSSHFLSGLPRRMLSRGFPNKIVHSFLVSILDARIAHRSFISFTVSWPAYQGSYTICDILKWPLPSSFLGHNVPPMIIFFNCTLCSSVEVQDHISRPYKLKKLSQRT